MGLFVCGGLVPSGEGIVSLPTLISNLPDVLVICLYPNFWVSCCEFVLKGVF